MNFYSTSIGDEYLFYIYRSFFVRSKSSEMTFQAIDSRVIPAAHAFRLVAFASAEFNDEIFEKSQRNGRK